MARYFSPGSTYKLFTFLTLEVVAFSSICRPISTNAQQNVLTYGGWSWGYNYASQLSYPSPTYTNIPIALDYQLDNLVKVTGGDGFAVGLKKQGTVWTWGDNYYSQLGRVTNSQAPGQITSLSSVVDIASGAGGFSLALKSDGTVWAWGYNWGGVLGVPTSSLGGSTTPLQIAGLSSVYKIFAGYGTAFAVKTDERVWAWGNGQYNRLGNGTSVSKQTTPVQVTRLINPRNISGNHYVIMAAGQDGKLYGWGNDQGRYILSPIGGSATTPTAFSGLSNIAEVQVGAGYGFGGGFYATARTVDEAGYIWGSGGSTGLGIGAPYNGAIPTMFANSGVRKMAIGYDRVMYITTQGMIAGFGLGTSGELGDGTYVSKNTAVQALGGVNLATDIFAFGNYTIAIISPGLESGLAPLAYTGPGAPCTPPAPGSSGAVTGSNVTTPETVAFNAINVAATETNTTATTTPLYIQDLRGSAVGWSSVCTMTNFTGQTDASKIIKLREGSTSKFSLTPSALSVFAGDPGSLNGVSDYTSGQETTSLSDATASGVSNSFNIASFSTGNGVGKYQKALDLSIDVPPYSKAQEYKGDMVCSVA